ncbi:MAG: 2-oxoglutarate dehydrogenase complex dihydrolipoyllysine-residue succinyltransferase [Gammaproteobacteria bacterium]|nr:2-oxoglutarate dehydrogenase complex dihydrolipoyllysine-residue succinyltransferase [Gammaproteobacteria bacterium]
MTVEVKVPALPESVADATILDWHRKVGHGVSRDENLVDLETDKVVLEVPAPVDGVLTEIHFHQGDSVETGQVLAIIDETATASAVKETATSAQQPAATEKQAAAGNQVLTPAVRRLVRELDLDPQQIHGSGKNGRILKADVMKFLDQQEPDEMAQELRALRSDEADTQPQGERLEQRVPMTRLRARVAERLLEAQQNAAILTTFNEVDLQQIMALRSKYNEKFEKAHDVRLGFMSFFIKACVEALKKFPAVNASVDGNDIIYHGYFDIGIAVGSPRGLVVPVLRDAEQSSFAELEKRIREYGQKAVDGTISYEDLSGGTFTISNGGVYGSMLSTPILNPPQSAILGMHNIQQRPVVIGGEIVIRPMMYLALSYDHRIIDGREAVQFLINIKESLEDPAAMLLGL